VTVTVDPDADGDGFSPPTDCDDGDPASYPGAPDGTGLSARPGGIPAGYSPSTS